MGTVVNPTCLFTNEGSLEITIYTLKILLKYSALTLVGYYII